MGKLSKKEVNSLSIESRAIHAGCEPDKEFGTIIPPIHQSSTYVQSSPGVHRGYEYTRSHNPTRTRLEESLASLESAKHCLVSASGMSAVTLLMHSLPAGSTIICGDDVYGGTYRLFTTVFNDIHKFIFVDTTNESAVKDAVKEHKPDLIWLESPTNPLLKITDIKKIATLGKSSKAKIVVDNTFMSPCFQSPLQLGADVVLHSLTKYINGHSDVVGGALMMNDKKLYDKVWYLQNSIGPSQSPFDSWLVLRGIKTLSVRMKAHEYNAIELAKWLEKHPKVDRVVYPGLKSHPQHKVAKKQMHGFGGMITFFIKGGLKDAKSLLKKVKIFSLAESLGGVESLIEHPAIMTHASVPKKVREKIGIYDTLVRISVGLENIDDLKNDLNSALK